MAPHLLQWHQIKYAKEKGFELYDFWGFDEKRWPGVSRFKLGFGGQTTKYPGTFDLILNKLWYFFYKIARKTLR
jgi:lipid II:glycine glycyltransferase (peptidoglycan interpeptide bridge formation enzyme)